MASAPTSDPTSAPLMQRLLFPFCPGEADEKDPAVTDQTVMPPAPAARVRVVCRPTPGPAGPFPHRLGETTPKEQ